MACFRDCLGGAKADGEVIEVYLQQARAISVALPSFMISAFTGALASRPTGLEGSLQWSAASRSKLGTVDQLVGEA